MLQSKSSLRKRLISRGALITGLGLAGMLAAPDLAFAKRLHGPKRHTHHVETVDAAGTDANIGIATFYGREHHGGPTASGERFDMNKMTAAHRKLPFGTLLKVTNLANGKSVIVRINDRGPYTAGRVLDLSKSAAEALDFVARGVTKVRYERV